MIGSQSRAFDYVAMLRTLWPSSLMCPQNRITLEAAITVCNQCLLLPIAALCFILCCGHINKYGHADELQILAIDPNQDGYVHKVYCQSSQGPWQLVIFHKHLKQCSNVIKLQFLEGLLCILEIWCQYIVLYNSHIFLLSCDLVFRIPKIFTH